MKIVVPENLELSVEQTKRLSSLGDVKIYTDNPKSEEEWLERVEGADVIGVYVSFIKQSYKKLRDVFVSCSFVDIGWADENVLKENGIKLKNSPGCNKESVSEWVVGMMINLFRELHKDIVNIDFDNNKNTIGLLGKKVCILGRGNIGGRVGNVCEALGMNVSYFFKSDVLLEKTKDQDMVINCLPTNSTTAKLLDKNFFGNLKKSSFFISISSKKVIEMESMFEAIDGGVLKGVALDRSIVKGEDDLLYLEIKKRKNIIMARTAARTDVTLENSNDMMINNIKEYLK